MTQPNPDPSKTPQSDPTNNPRREGQTKPKDAHLGFSVGGVRSYSGRVANLLAIFGLIFGLLSWLNVGDGGFFFWSDNNPSPSASSTTGTGNSSNPGSNQASSRGRIASAAVGGWDAFSQAPSLARITVLGRPTDGVSFVVGENLGGLGGSSDSIYYSSSANGWQPVGIVGSTGDRATATFDSLGNLHIMWQQRDSSTAKFQVQYVVVSPAGVVTGPRNLGVELGAAYGNSNGLPSLFSGGGTHLYLALEQVPFTPMAFESLDDGASWTGGTPLTSSQGSPTYPKVAGDSSGNMTVIYRLPNGHVGGNFRVGSGGSFSAAQDITPSFSQGGWDVRTGLGVTMTQDGTGSAYVDYITPEGVGFVWNSGTTHQWSAQQNSVISTVASDISLSAAANGTIFLGFTCYCNTWLGYVTSTSVPVVGQPVSFSASQSAGNFPDGQVGNNANRMSSVGNTIYFGATSAGRHTYVTSYTFAAPPTPTPAPTATATATVTPAPTATAMPTVTATATATSGASPTATATTFAPTATVAGGTATANPTPTPTFGLSPTLTPTAGNSSSRNTAATATVFAQNAQATATALAYQSANSTPTTTSPITTNGPVVTATFTPNTAASATAITGDNSNNFTPKPLPTIQLPKVTLPTSTTPQAQAGSGSNGSSNSSATPPPPALLIGGNGNGGGNGNAVPQGQTGDGSALLPALGVAEPTATPLPTVTPLPPTPTATPNPIVPANTGGNDNLSLRVVGAAATNTLSASRVQTPVQTQSSDFNSLLVRMGISLVLSLIGLMFGQRLLLKLRIATSASRNASNKSRR